MFSFRSILSKDGVLYVKLRAGQLSYKEDPMGWQSLLAQTVANRNSEARAFKVVIGKNWRIFSSQEKNIYNCVWWRMLPRFIVVIISQYIHILNHYVVHLKLINCCMSIVSQFKKTPKMEWWKGIGSNLTSPPKACTSVITFMVPFR